MLSLLYAYLVAPGRLRLILRWLAMGFFIFILILVLSVFLRTLQSVRRNHGHSLFHPESHQPLSPDFITYQLHRHRRHEEGK